MAPNATAEQIAKLRGEMHLDENIVIQHGFFIKDLVSGDLGTSSTNRPVTLDIAQFPPATLELVFAGVIMVGLGLPLGILAARLRSGGPTIWCGLALLTVSAPSFVWAVL